MFSVWIFVSENLHWTLSFNCTLLRNAMNCEGKGEKTWHFGTWFSRHGGVGLAVGPDDLRYNFNDSMIL